MHRLFFLILSVCLLLDTVVSKRPNILFVIIDDLKPALNCYGDKIAYTPNIDYIANKSFVFNNAFAQVKMFLTNK